MFIKFSNKKKGKRYNPGQRKIIRKVKAYVSFLIAFSLVGSGIFFYSWPRVNLVTLTYDYNKLRAKENELIQLNRMLKLELASIKSLEKVEKIATEKMGMIEPKDEDIIFIKVKN
tara:strand:+ start:5056 stop:5400 length:345 start_codon:yes stop_codon:yes gene_type:complete